MRLYLVLLVVAMFLSGCATEGQPEEFMNPFRNHEMWGLRMYR